MSQNPDQSQPNDPADPQAANADEAQGHDAQAGAQQAGEQAEQIAAEGAAGGEADVRERVRRLVVETVEQRKLNFEQLNDVTQQVLEGAATGVKEAKPDEQDSVLRGVVDGIADAYATAANATRLAFEEANQRRQTFADEDLKRAVRDLRALDERFVRTVSHTAERGWGALKEQSGAVKDHAQRAAQSIRPSMEDALGAAKSHPVKLTGEAAAAGVEVTRQATGRLLQVMSGLLQGAGDALTEPRGKAKDKGTGKDKHAPDQ